MSTAKKKNACVTGGNGYISSALIKRLLEKGYAVTTTVREPDDMVKNSHLREMQVLGSLQTLRADLNEEGSFDEAVGGCTYVFLVAAPVNLMSENPEKELLEPAVRETLNVMRSCVKVGSVTRVILTSSAAAVSCRELEGSGHVLDEESWSDTEYLTAEKPPTWGYAVSKVIAEREACKFAQENNISLVTVLPTLTVGATPAPNVQTSILLSLALLSGSEGLINGLKGMQTISGSVSLVHVNDVCSAQIFVAETESASGRYICCAIKTSVVELARFLASRYLQYIVDTNFGDFPEKARLRLSSGKLLREGFEFKYKNMEEIYDDVVAYGKAKGLLLQ